jgi:hypothetical protein
MVGHRLLRGGFRWATVVVYVHTGARIVTQVDAIQDVVVVQILIRDAAATPARFSFAGITGAAVVAIGSTVAIGVVVGNAATACADGCLARVVGASVNTVRCTVTVGVRVGVAAPT